MGSTLNPGWYVRKSPSHDFCTAALSLTITAAVSAARRG